MKTKYTQVPPVIKYSPYPEAAYMKSLDLMCDV